MPRKVIIVADPGIDGAFAGALALNAPELEVIGLAATAGNVPAEQATRNVHILVEQLDPARWPRLGAALPAAEFPADCDPVSARRVLHCGAPLTLRPLDVTRKTVFSPTEMLHLPNPESPAARFLARIAPPAIAASSGLYGVEGVYLP